MIREYRDEDLEELIEVWHRASLIAHPFLDDTFLARERGRIARVYVAAADTWVYELDAVVVGFIALIGHQVGAIFVEPALQGRGIGRALMAPPFDDIASLMTTVPGTAGIRYIRLSTATPRHTTPAMIASQRRTDA